MNIFVLDEDPVKAARDLCNKHIPKMLVESVQLLCAAHPVGVAPYRHTHVNHPCAKWTRASIANYDWLVRHACEINVQYTSRYAKTHKSSLALNWCKLNVPALPAIGLTPFAIAIKDASYHDNDVVTSYRAYYIGEKSRFAIWEPRASQPDWWPFKHGEMIIKKLRKKQ